MTLHPADPLFLSALAAQLPENTLSEADPRFLQEPRGRFTLPSGALARPRSVEEVSTIITACAKAHVGVVPFGGGTGLVGGQVAPTGPAPLILSLERMNAIRAVYASENVLVAEAGAILTDVQAAANEQDRLFPLSLASEGSARIGGNLSTNAGGLNVLRYGNTRDLCLGLEAVLPTGEIWHGLSRLRKDNTGYDLKNLLIGAEGTLGVITAASLKLFARPAASGTAVMVVKDPSAALSLLSLARDQIGESISAFELIHRQGLEFLSETLPDVRQPFQEMPEWMVLIDVGVSQGGDPAKALESLFMAGHAAGWVVDGLIAQNETQRAEFWSVREHIPEANKRIGSISSHDISIPLGEIADFITEGKDMVAQMGPFRVNCFGHLGDGNLHFNVFAPKGQSRDEYRHMRDEVQRGVHDLVKTYQGSFSAEHGIGRLKVNDLARYADPVKLSAMRAIKSALDPRGIMNPGAVLD